MLQLLLKLGHFQLLLSLPLSSLFMKKIVFFLLIAWQAFAQAPEVVWTVGTIGGDVANAYVRTMRSLPNGDFYVHYTFTGVRRSIAQHVLACYKPTG